MIETYIRYLASSQAIYGIFRRFGQHIESGRHRPDIVKPKLDFHYAKSYHGRERPSNETDNSAVFRMETKLIQSFHILGRNFGRWHNPENNIVIGSTDRLVFAIFGILFENIKPGPITFPCPLKWILRCEILNNR